MRVKAIVYDVQFSLYRLKMLLPQSQVQAPRQHPSKINSSKTNQSNHSTKTTCVKKSREDVEAFDSEEGTSSDDTIDEFISSEDVSQINQRLFSKSTVDKTTAFDSMLLGLPSMLSTRHRKTIGVPSNASVTTRVGGDCSTSETSSVKSSSGSATVGSLQQSSLDLDLSEESTHNEHGTMAAATDGTADGGGTRPTRNEADGSGCGDGCGLGLQQPSLDLSFDDSSESPSCYSEEKEKNEEGGDSNKLTVCSAGGRESEQLSIEEEWHLTLECSSEEEKRSVVGVIESNGRTSSGCPDFSKMVGEPANDVLDVTPKADDSIATPPAKRRRRSRERKKKPHSELECTDLLTPIEGEMLTTAITPRKLFHKSSSKIETKQNEKKRKKVRKSKTERDREKFKDVEVIDLTQEEDEDETRQTCSDVVKETGVTGTNKLDDVINKGKSPKQCTPPPPPPHTKTADHHSNFKVTPDSSISIPGPKVDGEADSDITFCEDDSGSYGGSPFYLPPTPGREKVNSILTRKSIAFSD